MTPSELINKHIKPMFGSAESSSIAYFLKHGVINGSFLLRLEALIEEASIPKSKEVLVVNTVIDITKVVDIYDIEKYKVNFLNRHAGFVIVMVDGATRTFCEAIPYESYPHEIMAAKYKWKSLQDQVEAEWKANRVEIKTFK